MRIVAALALLLLAACSHEDEDPCRADGALRNPYSPSVLEAKTALTRLKALAGPSVIDPRDEAALGELSCTGSDVDYARFAHTMVAPFWWAYWSSSCEGANPPAITGVPANTARIAFALRCPRNEYPGER